MSDKLKIDIQILGIDKVICSNIETHELVGRGLASQNVISHLRNFVEHLALKVYSKGNDIDNSYENIQDALLYLKSKGQFKFLTSFHKLLQITASHYTLDEENSERLMLKYFEYLIRIRKYARSRLELPVLENLEKFPLKQDKGLLEYYMKIAEKIEQDPSTRVKSTYSDRYYIKKIKPFFIGIEIYYEVTYTRAINKVSKFDRIIAFTKLDIIPNYAVKLSISKDSIYILDKEMPIQIIDFWEVSVRNCEFNNFADIIGNHPTIGGTKEILELMNFIKVTKNNLVDLILSDEAYFTLIKKTIIERTKVQHFFNILEQCRAICKNNQPGSNVIKYLLYSLNNQIIKRQRANEPCKILSNLLLAYGCTPFDQMPFNSSLMNHNPKLFHLLDCIDSSTREHELFARYIRNNTEIKGMLYTPLKDIEYFENIPELTEKYNASLYYKHGHRKIKLYKDHLYIMGYESDVIEILIKLKTFSESGIKNYGGSVQSWLDSKTYIIDSDEKSSALVRLFEHSKVALIYGAAGTGKSTMINHISNFFKNDSKLFLANTNPAVDNLKRKVTAPNCEFKTIAKFISSYNDKTDYDLIVIDECSTVSNLDMVKLLNKSSSQLLVLVGDIYQIESIRFGNWFSIVKKFIHENSIFELTKPYRTKNENLLLYWKRVRNIEENILELSTKKEYSVTLDDSIFEGSSEDEIILCLNYDGLYGINNINRFLQRSNPSKPIEWGINTYKINDPILFNENERFNPLLYNNLKGIIRNIELFDDQVHFEIELDIVINEFETQYLDLELLENSDSGNSVVKFIVYKYASTDEDDNSNDRVVPFQVAYAISIHKAQGLEFDSVKVVITNEVEEMISHNIFYTAVTRARESLKIYWSPESENKILSGLKTKFNNLDISLLKSKGVLA